MTFTYNAKNHTGGITPFGGSIIPMYYTRTMQTQRVSAGSKDFTDSLLGLNREVNGSTSTYFTRDEQGQLLAERIGGSSYYYLFDAQGNVAALTDHDFTPGTVVNTYRYDPCGRTIASTGSVANPYRYGGAYGAYTDSHTGLIKMGARYYQPIFGSWSQQDFLAANFGSPTTLNRYAYSGCNAVNFSDPSGLDFLGLDLDDWTAAFGFAGGVCGAAALAAA